MSILGNVFGTTGIVGGQTLATNNAAQGVTQSMQNAYNQTMLANTVTQPLVSTPYIGKSIVEQVRNQETNFTVVRAHNGYMVTARNYENDTTDRYIASTVEEVKELVVSILVQNKLDNS